MFVEGFEVLAGEQLSEDVSRKAAKAQALPRFQETSLRLCVSDVGRKLEGSDDAEPSLEGPVGKTTGNRPLNNQFPVNPTVALQNAGLEPGQSKPRAYKLSLGRDVGEGACQERATPFVAIL